MTVGGELPVWLRPAAQGWVLTLHIQPGAKQTGVQGEHGDALKIRLAAPPVDGKANSELLRYIASRLGLTQRDVELVSGQTSRQKRVRVVTASTAQAVSSALWNDERVGSPR